MSSLCMYNELGEPTITTVLNYRKSIYIYIYNMEPVEHIACSKWLISKNMKCSEKDEPSWRNVVVTSSTCTCTADLGPSGWICTHIIEVSSSQVDKVGDQENYYPAEWSSETIPSGKWNDGVLGLFCAHCLG